VRRFDGEPLSWRARAPHGTLFSSARSEGRWWLPIPQDGGWPPWCTAPPATIVSTVTASPQIRARRSVRDGAFSARSTRPVVRLADEDRGLLGGVPEAVLETARHQLVARTVWAETGHWDPPSGDLPASFDGWLGLLVLEGLLVREVQLDALRCCELLGPGDLVRPWDEDDGAGTIECRTTWRVLEPVRLALLDDAFARRTARWPTVTGELIQRTLRRSRSQSVLLAITQARRADVRLRTLFAHLADRWGRVTPDGIILPLRLTHNVIAQLTGLRRPSVSISLAELEREGEIIRISRDNWLIALPDALERAA
jgi:CRP-like cAMP-binding protein